MAKTLQTSIEIGGILSPSLQKSIANAVNELNKMSKSTIESATTAQKLSLNLSAEEKVMAKLKDEYAGYVIEGKEGSKEAQNLASRIQELNGDINNNRDRLKAACEAADNLTNEFNRTGNEADGLGDSIRGVNASSAQANEGFTVFKATLANLASSAIQAAASALKGLAVDVVSLGREFQATMSEVQAISGASAQELEILESTAREFGATTTFSAKEAGDALKYMALAGWDVSQSTSALGGVLDLAAASGMELGMASDMVTDYLSAFSMQAEEAGYFADLLAKAQSSSNTSAMQLGEAYKNCAANFNAAGQDIETVTSILEGMANQGFKGSEAGTALAAVMRDITAAMKDGKIMIGDTSIEVMDAAGNYRDMTDVLAEVGKAVDGMGTAERAMAVSTTFTAKSTKGLNLILNEGMDKIAGYEKALRMASVTTEGLDKSLKDGGSSLAEVKEAFRQAGINGESFDKILGNSEGSSEKFTEMLNEACKAGYNAEEVFKSLGISQTDLSKAFENAEGSAEAMARVMNDNLAGDLKTLNSAFEELKLKIFDKLEPLLRKGVQFLSNSVIPAITNIKKYIPQITIALSALTAVIAAFKWQSILNTIAKVQGAIKGISATIGAVSAPAIAVIAVITAMAAAFKHLWDTNDKFRLHIISIWGGIKKKFDEFSKGITIRINKLGFSFKDITDVIKSVWEGFCEFLAPVFETAFKVISKTLGTVFDVILGLFDTFTALFSGDWEGAWENIKGVFSRIWQGITEVFKLNTDGLKSAADVFLGWFGTSWDEVWNSVPEPVRTAISDASGWISEKFGEAKDFVVNEAVPAIKEKWDEVAPKVQTAVDEAGRWISEKFGEAKDFVVNEAVPAIKEKWDEVAPKVQTAVDEAGRWISEKFGEAKDFVVNEAVPAIKEKWDEISPKVESAISTASGYILTKFGEAKDFVLNEAMPAIRDTWENVSPKVESAISDASGWISEKFGEVKDFVVNDVIPEITAKWDEISRKVSEVIDFISPYVTVAFEDIKSFVVDTAIPAVTEAFEKIKETVGPVIEFIKTDVIPKVKEIIGSVVNALQAAWSLIKELIKAFYPVFAAVFGTIAAVAITAWEVIKSAFKPVLNVICGAFKFAWNGIKTVWNVASNYFKWVIDNITSIFSVVKDLLSGDFSAAWDEIKEIFSNCEEFFDNIIQIMSDAFDAGVEFICTCFSALWDFLTDLFEPVSTWLTDNVLMPISDGFTEAWTTVTEFLSGIWEEISGNVTEIWTSIHDFISEKIDAAKTTVEDTVNGIKLVMAEIWGNIVGKVSEVWENVRNTISEKFNAAKSTVSEVIENVKGTMSRIWDNISSKVSEIWGNIYGTIKGKIDDVKYKVSEVFEAVKTKISDTLQSALSTVTEIFGKIFDKIKGKITDAKDTVHEMIDAIKEKFNFQWELPKLKLPHFSIEGEFSLSPPSFPSFGVDWYANGGIMTKPTVFGANGNKLMVGGEAGAEAILPLKILWEKLSELFAYFMGNQPEILKEVSVINNQIISNTTNNAAKEIQFIKFDTELLNSISEKILETRAETFSENTITSTNNAAKEIQFIKFDTELLNSISEKILETRAETFSENTIEKQASRLITLDNFSLGEMASSGGTTIIYDFSNFTWSPNVEVDGKPDDTFMDQLKSHEYEFFDWLEEFVRVREASYYA